MGFIDFTNGEVLTADQMDLVMRQGIMRFADASARDTALSEVLAEGMMAYLDDTDEVLKYDGSQWIDISGDITGVTAGTALTGGGTSGNVTLDVDESALTIAQSQVTDLVSDLADKQDDVITTQGDLIIGDASGDPVRLPVGSADQVLTSDGTTVSFQDAGGGGIEEISSSSLTGNTVTFSSLPQNFKDLKIVIDNPAIDAITNKQLLMSFDSTSSIYGFSNAGAGFLSATNDMDQAGVEIIRTNAAFPDNQIQIIIPNYTSGKYKFMKIFGYDGDGIEDKVGGALQTTAITELNFTAQSGENFASGTVTVFGVK